MKRCYFIIILGFLLFISGCAFNTQKKSNVQTIGNNPQKQEEVNKDFILFKVTNTGFQYKDQNEVLKSIIEVEVIENFNNILNIKTDYSEYIDTIISEKKTLKLCISDTYSKYVKVSDEFIYKLDDIIRVDIDGVIVELFTTEHNEYTLLPIKDNILCMNYTTTNVDITDDGSIEYDMESIILERNVFYGYDFDQHFIEYDYSVGYHDYISYMFYWNPSIERFENMLRALLNENMDFFYKLKYSQLTSMNFADIRIVEEVENYLVEMAGE